MSLEQLNVVQLGLINLVDNQVMIQFTPTIPHCSMATLIGLTIQVHLLRSLPSKYKISVMITPGTHVSETTGNYYLL